MQPGPGTHNLWVSPRGEEYSRVSAPNCSRSVFLSSNIQHASHTHCLGGQANGCDKLRSGADRGALERTEPARKKAATTQL